MKSQKLFSMMLFGSLMLLQGCQTASSPAKNTTTPTTEAGTKPEVSSAGAVPEKELESLNAAVKGNGLLYSGLLCTKELTYEVTKTGADPEVGTSKANFVRSKDGKWIFERKRTGGLTEIMGDDTVQVDKKGIYVTEMSMGTLKKPMLELPMDIAVGSTWNEDTTMNASDGQEIKQTTRFKITKEEMVKTKAGEFKCLLIEVSGGGSSKTAKVVVKAKFWYTETYGPVKMITELTQNDTLKQEFTVQLSKL